LQLLINAESGQVDRRAVEYAPELIWRRSREGWKRCVELAEPLTPGSHQYFSEDADSALIEVTYLE
jgi:hypothetical protein